MQYVLIDVRGVQTVYNILACAKIYQKINGGVIKEVNLNLH